MIGIAIGGMFGFATGSVPGGFLVALAIWFVAFDVRSLSKGKRGGWNTGGNWSSGGGSGDSFGGGGGLFGGGGASGDWGDGGE